MPDKPPQVFISYSRQDAPLVDTVLRELRRNGVDYWSDEQIGSGEDIVEAIDTAIRQSSIFVLLVSPSFLDSNWSMLEAGAALARAREGAVVIPVILKAVNLPSVFAAFEAIDARKLPPSELAGRIRNVAQSAA